MYCLGDHSQDTQAKDKEGTPDDEQAFDQLIEDEKTETGKVSINITFLYQQQTVRLPFLIIQRLKAIIQNR